MTTDEMILALVATGKFTLPRGLSKGVSINGIVWAIDGGNTLSERSAPGRLIRVHDLCAMHFAREAFAQTTPVFSKEAWTRGDSAAAIKALYEAVTQ